MHYIVVNIIYTLLARAGLPQINLGTYNWEPQIYTKSSTHCLLGQDCPKLIWRHTTDIISGREAFSNANSQFYFTPIHHHNSTHQTISVGLVWAPGGCSQPA